MQGATDTLRVDHQIGPIEGAWEELAERVKSPPFLRAGWIGTWLQAFGASPLRIFSVWRDGRLVALAPLLARRGALLSPSNAHTPVFGLLAEDASASDKLSNAVLADRPRSVTLDYLDPHPQASVQLCSVLNDRGYRILEHTRIRSPFTHVVGDWRAFERRLSKSRRAELRRRQRRLSEHGAITIDIQDATQDLEALLIEGYRVEASGWKGEHGTAIQSTQPTIDFYSTIARWAVTQGWLRLAFLRIDRRAVAFQYLLQHNGLLYYLKGGYDETYRRWGPGILLSYEVLRHAFSDPSVHRFEWLGTDDPYKAEWSDGECARVRLDAFAPSAYGRAKYNSTILWRVIESRGKELARSQLPEPFSARLKRIRDRIETQRMR